ncbi:unnamed protein product [Polarella glacialis]|uniref:Uncharacterized protein n=1 Tax=Polarella glacialis TaxID=89957 RepID=A0A813I3H1_POLGL|nr:unnamed protein product [Polarella glacialis]CAE8644545.1 unnamed protein product [Polarella glacialis]
MLPAVWQNAGVQASAGLLPPLPLSARGSSSAGSSWDGSASSYPSGRARTERQGSGRPPLSGGRLDVQSQAGLLAVQREAERSQYLAARSALEKQAAELSQVATSFGSALGRQWRTPRMEAAHTEVGAPISFDVAAGLAKMRLLKKEAQDLRMRAIEARAPSPVSRPSEAKGEARRGQRRSKGGGKGQGKSKGKAVGKGQESYGKGRPKDPDSSDNDGSEIWSGSKGQGRPSEYWTRVHDSKGSRVGQSMAPAYTPVPPPRKQPVTTPAKKLVFGRYQERHASVLGSDKVAQRVKVKGTGAGAAAPAAGGEEWWGEEDWGEEGWGEEGWGEEGWGEEGWGEEGWGEKGWAAEGGGEKWGAGTGWEKGAW